KAEQRGGDDSDQQRDDERRPQDLQRREAHERRDHQHLALREVERAGGVVDDHEAQRHQRVDRSGGEAADDDVDEGGPGHEATKRQTEAPIAAHAVSTTLHGRPKRSRPVPAGAPPTPFGSPPGAWGRTSRWRAPPGVSPPTPSASSAGGALNESPSPRSATPSLDPGIRGSRAG